MTSTPVRVLVVDDSAMYRKFVREALSGHDDVEIVGVAHNGRAALDRVAELKPDLLTLDVEMPELDGLGVLKALRERTPPVGAIMCSSLSARGAAVTTSALELGAFDFVLKPAQSSDLQKSMEILRGDLLPKVRAFGAARRRPRGPSTVVSGGANAVVNANGAKSGAGSAVTLPLKKAEVVVIGVSTGGPAALSRLLPELPADLPVPVLVVQHMPPLFTKSLADDLRQRCRLKVEEATDGLRFQPGHVYLAPGGKQMKVGFGACGLALAVNDDPPERNCKPSVDYLFRSVAGHYGGKALALILTGMGDDGTEGCRQIKKYHGTVIAQSEASCVVYGMPRNVIEQGLADAVLDLEQIPSEILRLTKV